MNKLGIFCIYDSKARAYLQPFFSVNKSTAMRDFEGAVNDKSTGFCRHPADYTLFQIGEWDAFLGEINLFEAKDSLGTGVDFVRSEFN